jgi:D-alanine-D-alanine ligase
MKKLLIFHSPLTETAPPDELDVLEQVAFFKQALQSREYHVDVMPFPYDMESLGCLLESMKPELVVNLVETLFSSGRLAHLPPFLLEHFAMPYTGCPAEAIYNTNNKILAKQMMLAAGIPTPGFFSWPAMKDLPVLPQGRFLVKSVWEHASFGMDESKELLFDNIAKLQEQMQSGGNPGEFFAEQYIHGREFNLSVIDGPSGPQVLPPAEICFNFPEEKSHIVGYRAKWDESSFEYANTIRRFDFDDADLPLVKHLEAIALRCWQHFGLRGYARVDFRVDEKGNVFVLEVNANPCIAAGSGLVAAVERAGISRNELVERIIASV